MAIWLSTYRCGSWWIRRAAPVDQNINLPVVRIILDEILRQNVGIALSVINIGRSRRVISGRIARIKWRIGRARKGRIEVEALGNAGRSQGFLTGSLHLQIANHALLQHAIGIGRVALQVVAEVIDDKALAVRAEVAGAGVAQG